MSTEVTIDKTTVNGHPVTRFTTYVYDREVFATNYMEEVVKGVMERTIKAVTEEYIAENKANIMFKIDQIKLTELTTVEIAKEVAKGLAEEISRKIIKNIREEDK